MEASSGIESFIVEFQRFGEAAGLFRGGERYLLTQGWNKPVVEREMPLDQNEFLRNLNLLRYLGTSSEAGSPSPGSRGRSPRFHRRRVWTSVDLAAEMALVRPEPDLWAYGTLAELQLLARVAGRGRASSGRPKFLEKLKEGSPDYAVASTRYQLEKYAHWWTREKGFLGAGRTRGLS
jgi:hypothetical protein